MAEETRTKINDLGGFDDLEVEGYEVMTPTWLGVLPVWLAVLENPQLHYAADGRVSAREELRKMAGLADAHVATIKHMQPVAMRLIQAVETVDLTIDDPDKQMFAQIELLAAARAMAIRW